MKCLAAAAIVGALLAGVAVAPAEAQLSDGIETRTIEYEHDGEKFRGYLAKPKGLSDDDDRPGVLVVHEWWGLNDYAQRRARMLAELGYVAFAADMFGEGKTTDNPVEAAALAGAVYAQRQKMRDRAEAALDVLEDVDGVDDDRLAAIGYCFGGTTVLELAYAEGRDDADADEDRDELPDLRGVVSFHGNPKAPNDDDKWVPARVLLLHGSADPMVKESDVNDVAALIRERGGDARVIAYPGAEHAFTNPGVDAAGIDGASYQKEADEQSWEAMKAFLQEVLKEN